MSKENLDILFLVETDTTQIVDEKDYALQGFKTFFQKKIDHKEKTRIICLAKEHEVNASNIKLRLDLMSEKFPSIWLEVMQEHNKNM